MNVATPAPAKKRNAARSKVWAADVPPRLAKTNVEHRAMLDELMRIGRRMDTGKATPAEADAAQVLILLTGAYEDAHFALHTKSSTPLERLHFLVEESGISASDLGRLLGDRALGSRILKGERELSKAHIRLLAERFKLSPAYFL